MDIRIPGGVLSVAQEFTAEQRRPKWLGYVDAQEWDTVQRKAGLKPSLCVSCMTYCYPADLSPEILRSTMYTALGKPVIVESRVCLNCAYQLEG